MTPLEKAARALCVERFVGPDHRNLLTGRPNWREEADAFTGALQALRPDAPPAVQAWIDEVLSEGGER